MTHRSDGVLLLTGGMNSSILNLSCLLSLAMGTPKGLCAESTNILCTRKHGSNQTMLPPNETFYSFSESSNSIGPCVMLTMVLDVRIHASPTAPSNMCQKRMSLNLSLTSLVLLWVWMTHTSQTHSAFCCGMLCYLFALRYQLAVLIYPFLRNHAHLEARTDGHVEQDTLPSPGREWKLVARVWCLDKQKATWLKWVIVLICIIETSHCINLYYNDDADACISEMEGTMKPVLRIIHGATPAQTPRREPYVFDEPTMLRIKASLQLRPFLPMGYG